MLANILASLILLCSTGTAVLAAVWPPLNSFIKYGKTRENKVSGPRFLVDILADVTVPKSWFFHFYILLLLLLSIRWYRAKSINLREFLLFCQGFRRLLEQFYTFHVSSSSRIHLSHYIVGMLFYAIQALSQVSIRPNTTLAWCVAFFFVSFYQHACHRTLRKTPKYELPIFPLIGESEVLSTACPHYGAEIALYAIFLGLSDSSVADGGFYISLCSLIWVSASLCIAGEASRRYYTDPKIAKIRQRNIRWAVIPMLY